MTKIVLACDVGYGNVKAVWGAECNPNSEIIFRSIAIPVHKGTDINTSMGRVPVTVLGDTFLVGPDAYLSGGTGIPDTNFTERNEYLAFLRGAMHYMFSKTGVYHKIDTLVVGLPVGNFASHRNRLKEICMGEHIVPTPPNYVHALGATVKVTVDKVMVIPQPLGALSIFQRKCARANKEMGQALIIDPGYKTLDWVFSHGMDVDMGRSGSFAGGVSALLADISNSVGKKLGVGFIDLIEVESALSSGVIFADGRDHDFTPFKGIVNDAAAQVVDKFFSALKIERRFTSIVLSGGGGKYYRDAIAKKFPGHIVECEDDAVMDNARGFYLLARGMMP
jgi:plasmid segregation protein ParM